MTKIAVVSSSFPPLSSGGVSSAQFGLLLLLRTNKDYNVKGFTFSDQLCSKSDKQYSIQRSGSPKFIYWLFRKIFSILFYFIDNGKSSFQSANVFSSSIGSVKAAWKIKKFSPDIVIVSDHGAPMFFIYPFVKAKYIWTAHNNPMRFVNNPLVGEMSVLDAKLATFFEKKCIKKCLNILSPSEYMKDILKKTHNVKKNSFVVPNIVNRDFIDEIEVLEHSSCSHDEYKIFIPSAGSIFKGERYVLSIMQFVTNAVKDRNIVFILSGSVSDKLAYEISQQKNIKCITLGQQEYSINIAYLKSCDLCISPTLFESFGMAILESLLIGIPVVTFDAGGNRGLIKNGQNGYVVDSLDISGVCDKTIQLINKPIEKDTIKTCIKNIYSISAIKKNYLESSMIYRFKNYYGFENSIY